MKSQDFKTRASRALNEYKRKDWKGAGALYASDVYDIVKNAEFQETAGYVMDALRAGYMLGYKKGLREAREKTAKKATA